MIRNLIFLILTIASLAWIAYASQDLINFTGSENPERVFGQADGRVLILNRPNEIDISATDFQLQPRLTELFNLLKSNLKQDERIIVSEKLAHIVVEKSRPIDNERIKKLFGNEKLAEINSKKFIWKEFTLLRNKGVLEIFVASEKMALNKDKWYSFDKKSSCSTVEFNHGKPVITDYYQKDGVITSYARSPFLTTPNKEVNDQETFASHIPVYITNYQFIEKEYALRHDEAFRESVAKGWVNQGLVFFEFKDHSFLLTDFARGKEPDLFLDDYLDLNSEFKNRYTDLLITKNFPSNPKNGVYMRLFEEHVLFAEDEEALKDLEATLAVGEMLSLNKTRTELIFGQTPQKVCYREWDGKNKIAKSTYNGSSIEVKVSSLSSSSKLTQEKPSTTAGLSLDSPLKHILVHPSQDQLFALSDLNYLYGLVADESKFKVNLNESTKGEIQWLNANKNEILVTGMNQIHVLNKEGKYLSGFPATIPGGISKQAKAFAWKGKTNFLAVNASGTYYWLNEAGKVVKSGKLEVTQLTATPEAWVSQNKLFFGFHGDGNFTMIEAEKNKLFRSFPLPIATHTVILSNEIVFYELESKTLFKYNQRGLKSKVAEFESPSWLKVDARRDGSFYIKDGANLFVFADNGSMKGKIQSNSNDIDFISKIDATSKGAVVGFVDGVNNKIHLFGTSGSQIPLEANQGQKAFGISTVNGRSKLYTISDKFVIHYVL